ncbi:MAG: hypothetical protein AAF789_07185 [Bacteroidota bacterium]
MRFYFVLLAFIVVFAASSQPNSFFISGALGIGPGISEFSFNVQEQAPGNTLSSIARREFAADLFQANLNVSAGYRFKRIGIGITSYVVTQKDSDASSTVFRRGGIKNISRGNENHPNSKRYIGVFVDYDLHTSETISFSSRIELLTYRFSNSGTFISSPTYVNNSMSYNDIFIDRFTLGFSPRFKFLVAQNQSFFVGLSILLDSFEINESYLKEKVIGFRENQRFSSLTIGYEYRL